jgi:hypothetical protein
MDSRLMEYLPSVAAIIVIVSVVIVLILNRLIGQASARERGSADLNLGGVKFAGFEVVAGSTLSVALILSLVFYGSLSEELSEGRSARMLGAWQIEGNAAAQGDKDATIRWLMDGERRSNDDDWLDSRTQMAISLIDRHEIAEHGFGVADTMIHGVFWLIGTTTVIQILLLSRYLHGMRIVMPSLMISLILLTFYLVPRTSEIIRMSTPALDLIPMQDGLP